VGTITEIYDYLRLLYAKVGQPRCPQHGAILEAQTISQMVDIVSAFPEETKIMILARLFVNVRVNILSYCNSYAVMVMFVRVLMVR
jgi:excinuclease UvrABC ATPase subunit